jgi:hypothetical protein
VDLFIEDLNYSMDVSGLMTLVAKSEGVDLESFGKSLGEFGVLTNLYTALSHFQDGNFETKDASAVLIAFAALYSGELEFELGAEISLATLSILNDLIPGSNSESEGGKTLQDQWDLINADLEEYQFEYADSVPSEVYN